VLRRPTIERDNVAWITETDMIEVDRVMIEDLHIELLQMMENAGRNLARLVLDLAAPTRVAVAAGSGGNGGGGLVAARHLANAGVDVTVTTTRPGDALSPVPAHQFDILRRMGVPTAHDLGEADVVIDALIGYSLRGAPSGRSATLIDAVNAHGATVVSLDTPSGLDVSTGATPGTAVRADATLTLALPKIGMRDSDVVGALYLADISVPRSVTEAYGAPAPDFGQGSVLQIR
jgi:NAD(P)H-hydrate epimerase